MRRVGRGEIEQALGVVVGLGMRLRSIRGEVLQTPKPRLEVFYDGKCSLCRKEIEMLKGWDDQRSRVVFTDLNMIPGSDDDVNKLVGGGFSGGRRGLQEFMTGRELSSGDVYRGMDLFRRMYTAIGSVEVVEDGEFCPPPKPLAVAAKWAFLASNLPVVHQVADAAYAFWAKRRLERLEAGVSGSGAHASCVDGSCTLYPKPKSNGADSK